MRRNSSFEVAGAMAKPLGETALPPGVSSMSLDSYDSAVEDAQRAMPKVPCGPELAAPATPTKPNPPQATLPKPAHKPDEDASPGPSVSEAGNKARSRTKSPTYWRTDFAM